MSKSTDDLAAHLSAILAHPDTPTDLYNEMVDTLLTLSDQARAGLIDSPEVLRVALPLIVAKLKGEEVSPFDAPEQPRPSTLQRIAHRFADLLGDPATPEVLRSTLDEFCTELSDRFASGYECVCTPDTVRKNLPMLLARGESAGLRCPNGGIMLERETDEKEIAH